MMFVGLWFIVTNWTWAFATELLFQVVIELLFDKAYFSKLVEDYTS